MCNSLGRNKLIIISQLCYGFFKKGICLKDPIVSLYSRIRSLVYPQEHISKE